MMIVRTFSMKMEIKQACNISFVGNEIVWWKFIHHPQGRAFVLYDDWKVKTGQHMAAVFDIRPDLALIKLDRTTRSFGFMIFGNHYFEIII